MLQKRRQRIGGDGPQAADRRACHRKGQIVDDTGWSAKCIELAPCEATGGQLFTDFGEFRRADAAGNAFATRLSLKEF
jgi:hypothetical protein